MDISFVGTFKSITSFDWIDIPSFSIITGINGSGKSQLLQLIYDTITNNMQQTQARVTITNESFKKGEITFLKSEWMLQNTYPINLMTLQQGIDENSQTYHQAKKY